MENMKTDQIIFWCGVLAIVILGITFWITIIWRLYKKQKDQSDYLQKWYDQEYQIKKYNEKLKS